ncbi:hypothetical protein [Aquimarina sp. 2304DJ70-9]|uniref:hypothetical protein n=1 Tax=Aquimarina penaris TaxID=3231044 RepID=UPI0034625A3A
MAKINIFILAFVSLFLANCKTENEKYPIDKRYWDTMDYANVIRELKYGYEPDEKLPSYSDPENRIVFEKLVDQQNFKIVLDDNELGKKHRNEISSDFFMRWKDMNSIYRSTDRKDNYIYDRELIKVWHFGLSLQLRYFKLGNDVIIESSDDPNSGQASRVINSNKRTLVGNFNYYLDEINDEKAFSDEGKELLSNGIDLYFTELIELYPKANYSGMLKKIELMQKKSKSESIKTSLDKLKKLIESNKDQNNSL